MEDIADKIWLPDEILMVIQPQEELCLFLMLWLSMVVFPSSSYPSAVRNSLIVAASEIAQGRQLALAPRVLCYIYRGLGVMATSMTGPRAGHSYIPVHYFMAWIGTDFPWTFESTRKGGDLAGDIPPAAVQ